MRLIHIPAKAAGVSASFQTRDLPKRLGLLSTVQFADSLKGVKSYLEKAGKKVFIGKSRFLSPGQVLGCDVSAAASVKSKIDAFLYVGTGRFHPLAIALETGKQVLIFDPETNILSSMDERELRKAKAVKRTQQIKLFSADRFGILVSTKPGQARMKEALALKAKLEKRKKKAYIFLSDTFDMNQLENFPQIECWVNTMCPGLSREQPFVWIGDIKL